MDSEQKIRLAYIAASVVIALSLVYVIYAFMERPWHDNEEMLVFTLHRDIVDKIVSRDLVVCDARLFERNYGYVDYNFSWLNNSS